MIYATLENARHYYAMSKRIEQALRFLQTTDLYSLVPGRHEINGDDLYANVFEYATKSMDQAAYEGHRAYLDLQYVFDGEEVIYCGLLTDFTMKGQFDAATDSALFDGEGFPLKLDGGRFLLLWPEDIHAPGIDTLPSRQRQVRKIVIKIRL